MPTIPRYTNRNASRKKNLISPEVVDRLHRTTVANYPKADEVKILPYGDIIYAEVWKDGTAKIVQVAHREDFV